MHADGHSHYGASSHEAMSASLRAVPTGSRVPYQEPLGHPWKLRLEVAVGGAQQRRQVGAHQQHLRHVGVD